MFNIINKIGGRKVVIILFSSVILMVGFFLMQEHLSHYQAFCAAIVSISIGFIGGNALSHKYNNNIPQISNPTE